MTFARVRPYYLPLSIGLQQFESSRSAETTAVKQQRTDDINNNNDNNNDISVDDFLHNGMLCTIILIDFVIVSVILCFGVWNFLLFICYDTFD